MNPRRGLTIVAFLALTVSSRPTTSLAQQPSAMGEGTGSIAGRVTAADSGKPIRGALVQITIYNNMSGRFRSVLTDAQGRYELTKLPAGQYNIAAQAGRYLRMEYGQKRPGPAGLLNPSQSIALAEAQAFTTADFALTPYSAIEGNVVDEFGEPAPNVSIHLSQLQYAGGRRRLVSIGGSADASPQNITDDQGHFRIGGLMPGAYYVEALAGAFADPSAAGGFAVTFYPGTQDPSAAQIVTVGPDKDALNIAFSLVPARTATVSGMLVDAGSGSVAGGNLILMPSEREGATLVIMVRSVADQAGRFTFRNLPPGTYTIQAFGAPVGTGGNLAAMAFGYRTFSVEGTDIDGLTVPIPAARTIRGHLTFDGDLSQLPKPTDVQLVARQIDFESAPVGGGPPPSKVNDDWTFEIGGMSGLRVIGAGARPGWVVKQVTLGGRDVSDSPVDLREHDAKDVEIVLTNRTTTLNGRVVDADDKPLAGYDVVVFADDETKWGTWSRYVVLSRSNAAGTFSLRGLPAGSYLAIAAPTLPNGVWQDPAFLLKQRGTADVARFALGDEDSRSIKIVGRKQ